MPFCRPRWTLEDTAATKFNQLQPGAFFTLIVNSVTYYGIADAVDVATPTIILANLYSDVARTVEVTSGVPTAVPYSIDFFSGWDHEELIDNTIGNRGTFRSNTVTLRTDQGLWTGFWRATPEATGEIEYQFIGDFTFFALPVVNVTAVDQSAGGTLGAGTYTYCITALDGSGNEGAGSAAVSVTIAANRIIRISWPSVIGAASYNIYGRGGFLANVVEPITSYDDDGSASPTSQLPPLVPNPALVRDPNDNSTGTDTGPQPDDGSGQTTVGFDATGTDQTPKTDPNTGAIISEWAGTVSATNGDGLWDLQNFNSTSQVLNDVIIDPSLFEGTPTGTITVTLSTHVTTSTDGLSRVVTSTNSATGETAITTILISTGAFTTVTTLADGTLITDTGILDPADIPVEGSTVITITYDTFIDLGGGVFSGRETVVINTFLATFLGQGTPMLYMVDKNGKTWESADGSATWTAKSGSVLISDPVTEIPVGFYTGDFKAANGWFVIKNGKEWGTAGGNLFHYSQAIEGPYTAYVDAAVNGTISLGEPLEAFVHAGEVAFTTEVLGALLVRFYPSLVKMRTDPLVSYSLIDVDHAGSERFQSVVQWKMGDGYVYMLAVKTTAGNIPMVIRMKLPATADAPLGAVEEVFVIPNPAFSAGNNYSLLVGPGRLSLVFQKTDGNTWRAVSTNGTTWTQTNLGQTSLYTGPDQTQATVLGQDFWIPGIGFVCALGTAAFFSADGVTWNQVAFAIPQKFHDSEDLLGPRAAVTVPAADGTNLMWIGKNGTTTVLDYGFNLVRNGDLTPVTEAEQDKLRSSTTGISGAAGGRPGFNPNITILLAKAPLARPPLPPTPPLASKTRFGLSTSSGFSRSSTGNRNSRVSNFGGATLGAFSQGYTNQLIRQLVTPSHRDPVTVSLGIPSSPPIVT